MPGNRILIVEDEPAIRRILAVLLTASGYEIVEAASGRDAVRMVAAAKPDLLVLDLGLPDIDGSEVVTRVRELSRCPILIISVRGHESDKVAVLNAGADDYLTKPFGNLELLARIGALLRRAVDRPSATNLEWGNLTLDSGKRAVHAGGKRVRLTRTEYTLLNALMEREGNIATHRQLIREVWSGVYDEHTLHVLHVTISNLRRKLERDALQPDYILTEPGMGYRIGTVSGRPQP